MHCGPRYRHYNDICFLFKVQPFPCGKTRLQITVFRMCGISCESWHNVFPLSLQQTVPPNTAAHKSKGSLQILFCFHTPRLKFILRQYRTILSVESRRQIFWQVKQKAQRILCVFASIFVTVAGKSASEATLKASAVNCAVLPWMKKGFPTPFWRHSPRGLHFAAQRCMALPPPAFSPGLFFYFFIFFDSLKSTGAGLYLPLCFSFLR